MGFVNQSLFNIAFRAGIVKRIFRNFPKNLNVCRKREFLPARVFKSGGICYTKKKKRPGRAGNGVVIFMDSNRVMLKADARRRTVSCQPSPILAGLIVFALGMLISTLTSYLMGMDRLATALTNAARFGTEAVEQAYLSFLEHYSVSGFAIALVVALRIMSYMVSVGFVIFTLHVSRDEKAEFGNLFDGFGLFFRVLWLGILEGLLIFLWSLLLVVPGIVAAYRYRQALYLLLDHPERSAWQCLRESSALMSGHKWELFVLDLSFLGWAMLSAMFAPVSIWLDPYRAITNAGFYNRLIAARGGAHVIEGSFTDIPNDPQC